MFFLSTSVCQSVHLPSHPSIHPSVSATLSYTGDEQEREYPRFSFSPSTFISQSVCPSLSINLSIIYPSTYPPSCPLTHPSVSLSQPRVSIQVIKREKMLRVVLFHHRGKGWSGYTCNKAQVLAFEGHPGDVTSFVGRLARSSSLACLLPAAHLVVSVHLFPFVVFVDLRSLMIRYFCVWFFFISSVFFVWLSRAAWRVCFLWLTCCLFTLLIAVFGFVGLKSMVISYSSVFVCVFLLLFVCLLVRSSCVACLLPVAHLLFVFHSCLLCLYS